MIVDDGTWSLGVKIGLPVLVVLLVVCLTVAAFSAYFAITASRGYRDDPVMVTVIATVIALALTVIGLFAYWPLKAEYHKWYQVEGKVTDVSSRLVGSKDDGTSEKFVVRLDPSGELFGITDTRAATLEVGDTVRLKCKKAYVYSSTSGWDCNWVDSTAGSR